MNNPKGSGPDVPIAYGESDPPCKHGDTSGLCVDCEIDQLKAQLDKVNGWRDELAAKFRRANDEKAEAFAQVEILRTQLAAATAERDTAIKEANRRDQKWMDGINEIVGRKLDYGDPSSPNCASTALEKLVKERDAAQKACAEMRELLLKVHRCCCDEADWDTIDGDAVKDALSSSCLNENTIHKDD